ncbi:MAG: 30S ribosomal protein S16 [Actinomycetota bacterium]|nr:30S ribosomal protein S16 [Actinomycetota bacterium]
MATKIRLTRLGKKKQPTYRVVVMDSRKPRDGRYIEQLGIYDPRQNPSLIKIDNERALYWLNTGAQPTERVQKLLEISGAWTQFKVSKGEIHTIAEVAVEDVAEVVAEIAVEESAEVVAEIAVEESAEVVAEIAVEESAEVVAEIAVEDTPEVVAEEPVAVVTEEVTEDAEDEASEEAAEAVADDSSEES